jgi:hypothetical protein
LEVEASCIVLHLPLPQIKPKRTAFLLYFSLLHHFPSIVDGFHDLIAVFDDHVFLHHFAEEGVLHLSQHILLLYRLKISHQLGLFVYGSFLPALDSSCSPFLFF